MKCKRLAHSHIRLYVRRSTKFVERCLYAVDDRAIVRGISQSICIHRSSQREWAGAFGLKQQAKCKTRWCTKNSSNHHAAANVFSSWPIISAPKGAQPV